MDSINIKKVFPHAKMPSYATAGAAGADLFACLETSDGVQIGPGESKMIHTGIAIEIPYGYGGLLYARSWLACKRGLAPANKVGVIDSDYRGEIIVVLHNHSDEYQYIYDGDRIAQLVISAVETPNFKVVDTLSDTVRSDGGFGSTGK